MSKNCNCNRDIVTGIITVECPIDHYQIALDESTKYELDLIDRKIWQNYMKNKQ